VRDLPELLGLGRGPDAPDLMVFNESRVLPAWFSAVRRATGGGVTGLYLGPVPDALADWRVLLESGGRLRAGDRLGLRDGTELELLEPRGEGEWRAACSSGEPASAVLQRVGEPPLPPYIRKRRARAGDAPFQPGDAQRYNTVFARHDGSVAAPTAGLHFTHTLLERLRHSGVATAAVTLHVGQGTFAPVRSERVEDHPIHHESFEVSPEAIEQLRATRQRGGRIIPVGTTSVRALESLPDPLPEPGRGHAGEASLLITPDDAQRPGHRFRFADALMTNFHLPRSTLLALVAALPGVGVGRLLGWYRLAIDRGYRFYSYGDAMLLL
jgi:S-adenosylmethionine:tRNA ribosyltransferase-isomerase